MSGACCTPNRSLARILTGKHQVSEGYGRAKARPLVVFFRKYWIRLNAAAPRSCSTGSGRLVPGRLRRGARASADSDLPESREGEVAGRRRRNPASKESGVISHAATSLLPGRPEIHPTAIVHPDAILGQGVVVGPFCTVGPEARLGDGCVMHANSHIFGETELGERCVIYTGAVVGADIPGHTAIGNNNSIGYHAVVGVKCQDLKYKEGDDCSLIMGHNNDVREYVSIHRSSKPNDSTIIGSDNLIMGTSHIAHDCKMGNRNILANGTLLGGHVVLEDFVHTGGAVAVHQFCHIASYSFLAGGSMVDRDVPMYMMVAGDRAELRGLNLEGLRRCGFSDTEVRAIRSAYIKLFMNSNPDAGGLEERLSELGSREELCRVPAVAAMLQSVRDCFAEKRRGICKFRHWTSV